jgi:hypothetical protein
METIQKLPEDFKQKWVAALRSGEYKQGREELFNKRKGCYCCLGVAGKLLGIEESYLLVEGCLPDDPIVPPAIAGYNGAAYELIHLNDGLEKSFSEIADYIEKNL